MIIPPAERMARIRAVEAEHRARVERRLSESLRLAGLPEPPAGLCESMCVPELRESLWLDMGILAVGGSVPRSAVERRMIRLAIANEDWAARRQRKRYIRPRTRRIVIDRALGCCTYCGRPVPDGAFHIDHIRPLALGGRSRLANLAAACWRCNTVKSASTGWEPYGPAWAEGVLAAAGLWSPPTERELAAVALLDAPTMPEHDRGQARAGPGLDRELGSQPAPNVTSPPSETTFLW